MTELDDLEEISLGCNPTERPDGRLRNRIHLGIGRDRFNAAPKWLKQLRNFRARKTKRKDSPNGA